MKYGVIVAVTEISVLLYRGQPLIRSQNGYPDQDSFQNRFRKAGMSFEISSII
ncbi:hypothetical protein MNBD_CPR01-204 [hydrothermal vent metagenome]|uniref:Uncharacterized protein n=1 Tax=hydrothermal vent metagenome TaxID=652676 RepID=A0A3B0UL44_9ZZZZ